MEISIWAYGVSIFDFHCSDRGLNPSRGGNPWQVSENHKPLVWCNHEGAV